MLHENVRKRRIVSMHVVVCMAIVHSSFFHFLFVYLIPLKDAAGKKEERSYYEERYSKPKIHPHTLCVRVHVRVCVHGVCVSACVRMCLSVRVRVGLCAHVNVSTHWKGRQKRVTAMVES